MKIYKNLIEASKFSEKEPVPYHNDHGNISYCFDFEKVESVSALFDRLGISPDFSKIPPAILARAIEIGNLTHDALEHEQFLHEDLDVQRCLHSYELWKTFKFRIIEKEKSICKKINGKYISGRCDAIFQGMYGSGKIVIDYKTSSKIYETAKLQIAFYCLMFDIDAGAILHLKKDGSVAKFYTVEYKYIEIAKKLLISTPEEAQALLNDKQDISKKLVKEYLETKEEIDKAKIKLDSLREKIETSLDGNSGATSYNGTILTFSKTKDSERVKYDFKKMIADDMEIEKYKKISKVKGGYKVTTKKEKKS
jgi:hypothetical protein